MHAYTSGSPFSTPLERGYEASCSCAITHTVVTQMVAKIAICDCPMASGDSLIAKLAKWEECS